MSVKVQSVIISLKIIVLIKISTLTACQQYIHEEKGVERPMFEMDSYLKATSLKDGADAYSRNAFNQAASDKIGGERSVPDTRHSQLVKYISVTLANSRTAFLSSLCFS